MKQRVLLSIDQELRDNVARYIRTHKKPSSFSRLVALSLNEYMRPSEKEEVSDHKILLARQSLLAWKNLCEDILETCGSIPQDKINQWKKVMDQQEEVGTLLASISQDLN